MGDIYESCVRLCHTTSQWRVAQLHSRTAALELWVPREHPPYPVWVIVYYLLYRRVTHSHVKSWSDFTSSWRSYPQRRKHRAKLNRSLSLVLDDVHHGVLQVRPVQPDDMAHALAVLRLHLVSG